MSMGTIGSLRAPLTVSDLRNLRFEEDTFFIYSNAEGYDRANVEAWSEMLDHLSPSCYAVMERLPDQGMFSISVAGQKHLIESGDFLNLKGIVPEDRHIVVDISATGHEFMANCVTAFRNHAKTLTYIFTEPSSYKFRNEPDRLDPFDPTLFDLSAEIGGVRSLPGFANLLGPGRKTSIFVPLLGFEGSRALNVLNIIDPPPPAIIPIVGVPGYRLEFPNYTIVCNQRFFRETQSQPKIRKAAAHDPFDLYRTLAAIQADYPDEYMYIAPIGTRPHALGALMFAVEHKESTEILFDHPLRREKSRRGTGWSHVFFVP